MHISPDTRKIVPGAITIGEHRASLATRDLRNWLKKVDLPYHSPHKFRHGNAVYSLKLAKDIIDLKAVSQNLMHSNISITDGVYGNLSNIDLKDKISELSNLEVERENYEIINLLQQIKNKLDGITS